MRLLLDTSSWLSMTAAPEGLSEATRSLLLDEHTDLYLSAASVGMAIKYGLGMLPLPAHHRDPFDRLLIAQAQIEGLAIVTGDRLFERYDVQIVHA